MLGHEDRPRLAPLLWQRLLDQVPGQGGRVQSLQGVGGGALATDDVNVETDRTHLEPILMLIFWKKLMLKFGFFNLSKLVLSWSFLDFVIMRCFIFTFKKIWIQNRIDIWNWWIKTWRIKTWLTCGQQHRGFTNGGIFIQRPKKKNRKRKVKKVFVWFQIN